MGKRYLISGQQFKLISEELKAGYGKTIKSIETQQEVFSSTNTILLDVGFVKEYIHLQKISSIVVKDRE